MTYKDMTFCDGNGGKCQSFKTCFRALTEEVHVRAKEIGLPVSRFANACAQDCYIAPKEKNK